METELLDFIIDHFEQLLIAPKQKFWKKLANDNFLWNKKFMRVKSLPFNQKSCFSMRMYKDQFIVLEDSEIQIQSFLSFS